MKRKAFCIYINTVFEGRVPSALDETGKPFVFETEIEAQREIADNLITRLDEFMRGEREFEDAMTVEEYVIPVDVYPNGLLVDEYGKCF